MLRWLGILVIAASSTAFAQTLEEEQAALESGNEAAAEPDSTGTDRLDDEQAEVEDQTPREQHRDSTDPFEAQGQDYFFLGAFGRAVFIPGAIQGLFVAGGIDGFNPGTGLTFNWRKDNFNIVANVWWNNAVAEGYFRANGDPRTDMEFIDVDLGVIFINAEFLWSFPLVDWFAIELGFDLGIGFIYGDLVRTEAYESSTGADDWRPCNGPNDPNSAYCESPPAPDPCFNNSGAHYNCREGNWTEPGGDTPLVFPWIALPHFAIRFKPLHQLQIRIDVSYNLYAISFGGGVSYGF
jgi:hypothetical protein